ncbi:MAG: hypothetical protein M3347_08720 [Armatimonadota bacterium]|nr:hypothetical protein [Armatimonadota bacterium]
MNQEVPDPEEYSAEYQDAVSEALGEEPRSSELSEMQAVLRERREQLARELDTAEDAATRDKLRRDLAKLDEQIEVLCEESSITKFVEDSVRVSLEMRHLNNS